MEQPLKERLVGTFVLLSIAIIAIPFILGEPVQKVTITDTHIPQPPAQIELPEPTRLTVPPVTILEEAKKIQIKTPPEPTTKPKKAPEPTTKPKKAPEQTNKKMFPKQGRQQRWVVQVGGFSKKENATVLLKKLQQASLPAFVDPLDTKKGRLFRVRIGPENNRSDAKKLLKKIQSGMNLTGIVMVYSAP